ncbi:DUF2231 domain-containing protein [Bradyrhizobium neotropicale]|uniref:DUF2231 domain-containing protein n=1 Tax=Bradyrhizobium neotropicale TaxID=1497615 RepID=UPI001FEDBC15|nr:DUF2231 domain-containing protein [Bradyrhizobium neotropicale]
MTQIAVAYTNSTVETEAVPVVASRRYAIHQMLLPFSVAYLIGAFVTDLAYWRTALVMWERFSVWLIAAGLVIAALAAIAAVIDLLIDRQRPAWFRALAYVVAIALSIVNVLVHSRDGYTAVVPTGLALSGLVTILLLSLLVGGWGLIHGDRAGAAE